MSSVYSMGVYYARDHLESGGGKKMKNLMRGEKKMNFS